MDKRAYMRVYNRKPEVKAKISFYVSPITNIMSVFDSEQLTAEEIYKRLEDKFGVRFSNPETIKKKIDKTIEDLEYKFECPPIIKVNGIYKLNKKSPYWRLCGDFYGC